MSAAGKWKCYRTVFAAEAPVHIGWHRLGSIERTRYYISARAMWGATVAAMAPRLHGNAGVPGMYKKTERYFADVLRFTCFFVRHSTDPSVVWRPRYTNDGLFYGAMPAADFESRFVFSQTSAALNPTSLSAQDGALHESEFLCDGEPDAAGGRELHFTGYLLCKAQGLEEVVRGFANAVPTNKVTGQTACPTPAEGYASISVGGERNYGWGRLRLWDCQQTTERLFGEFELVPEESEHPRLRAIPHLASPSEVPYLPAHVLIPSDDSSKTVQLKGDVELLGGRDWGEKGSGRNLARLALCWAPGTRVEGTGATFEIGPLGVWSVLDLKKLA